MALNEIDTFIIVMLENRSFDHLLGYLSLPVEGLRNDPAWIEKYANYYQGMTYPIHLLGANLQKIDDPPHEKDTIALQINTPPYPGSTGLMGGFVESYARRNPLPADLSLVMGYYNKEAVPVFDFFARNFAVCDHWFSALPTGTQSNRLMAMSGESGIVDNAPVFLPDQDLVYDWLTAHQVSWCAYQSGEFFPFFSLMPRWLPEITTSLTLSELGGRGRFRRYSKFRQQWTGSDPMPSVIFIEPEYTDGPHGDPNDDHPPTGITKGQAFLADIYQTLIANPDRWMKTMMIVTYDEHGGFFDHVPPLAIPTGVGGFQFTTTGVRVPAFVISPQVAAGHVFSGKLDHTSILQLFADRFNPSQAYSAAVGARQTKLDSLAAALSDQPPQTMRAPTIPEAALASVKTMVSKAPPPPAGTGAPGAAANEQAFHNVMMKVAQDYPDLLMAPGWQKLGAYIDRLKLEL